MSSRFHLHIQLAPFFVSTRPYKTVFLFYQDRRAVCESNRFNPYTGLTGYGIISVLFSESIIIVMCFHQIVMRELTMMSCLLNFSTSLAISDRK